MSYSAEKLPKLGFNIALVMVVILGFSALSKYILPDSIWTAIFTPLYGEEYLATQLAKYDQNAGQEFAHRILGSLFLVAGLLQFKASVRKKRPKLHKIMGRLFVGACIIAGLSGIALGILMPYSGKPEIIPVVLFGGFMMVAAIMGVVTIRKGKVNAHTKWMVRCFAVGLGSATIRMVHPILLNVFTGIPATELFLFELWFSWILHLMAAELGLYFYFGKKEVKTYMMPKTEEPRMVA